MKTEQSSAAEVIERLSKASAASLAIADTHHLLVPDDARHVDITEAIRAAQPAPQRKKGTLTALDIASFIAMVKEQGGYVTPRVYADPDATRLIAVLNETDETSSPSWRDHRIEFKPEFSKEFARWKANSGQLKSQEEFATFIEDNIADIADPDGQTMLQVALTIQAKTDISFSSARRLENGQVQLQYTENIDARAGGGAIEIPREFAIGVRIFRNGEGYKVKARLKYRLGGGGVKFLYELDRPDRAVEDAFQAYIDAVRAANLTLFIAKP